MIQRHDESYVRKHNQNLDTSKMQTKISIRRITGLRTGEILVNQQNGELDNSKAHTKIPTNRNTSQIPCGSSVNSRRVLTA
jgi:hypothetical protein